MQKGQLQFLTSQNYPLGAFDSRVMIESPHKRPRYTEGTMDRSRDSRRDPRDSRDSKSHNDRDSRGGRDYNYDGHRDRDRRHRSRSRDRGGDRDRNGGRGDRRDEPRDRDRDSDRTRENGRGGRRDDGRDRDPRDSRDSRGGLHGTGDRYRERERDRKRPRDDDRSRSPRREPLATNESRRSPNPPRTVPGEVADVARQRTATPPVAFKVAQSTEGLKSVPTGPSSRRAAPSQGGQETSRLSASVEPEAMDTDAPEVSKKARKTRKTRKAAIIEDNEDDDIVVEDDSMAAMQAMMGFGGFDTTHQKKVVGNDISGIRKEKKTEYRQYMNRVGGFNRELSPTRDDR
jgi:U4/U6.U5 tri-snRNP-associated protein 3